MNYITVMIVIYIYSVGKITPLVRHHNLSLGANSIFTPPQAGHGLLLCVELQPRLAVECVRTTSSNTLFVTREREHGQRHGDGHVDTDLAGFDLLLELGGGGTRAGEDGGAVAVLVLVDQFDGVVEGGGVEADEDGAEDLLAVAFHVWGDVRDDGGADLVRVSKGYNQG